MTRGRTAAAAVAVLVEAAQAAAAAVAVAVKDKIVRHISIASYFIVKKEKYRFKKKQIIT